MPTVKLPLLEEQPIRKDRNARRRVVRATTVGSGTKYLRGELKLLKASNAALYPEDVQRPRTRGECCNGPRPCPWVSCQYNLYLDVRPSNGGLKLNFPDIEPHEMSESCVLDVADRGDQPLEVVGAYLNVTRERVRQCLTELEYVLEKELGEFKE